MADDCRGQRINLGVLSFISPYAQDGTGPFPASTLVKCRWCEVAVKERKRNRSRR